MEPAINSSQHPLDDSRTATCTTPATTERPQPRLTILHLMAWSAGVAIAFSLLSASNDHQRSTMIEMNKRWDGAEVDLGFSEPTPPTGWIMVIQALFYGTGIAFAGFAICSKRLFHSPGMMLLVILGVGALLDPLLSIVANTIFLKRFVPEQPLPTLFGLSLWGLNVQIGYLIAGCLSFFFFLRSKVNWIFWRPVFLAFAIAFLLRSSFVVDFDIARAKFWSLVKADLLFLTSWTAPCTMIVMAFVYDLIRRREIDWWTVVASSVFTIAGVGLIVSRILTGSP